jgi:hypothetical protein
MSFLPWNKPVVCKGFSIQKITLRRVDFMKMHFVRLLAVVAAFCALATLASAQDLIYNGNGFGQISIFENQVNVTSAVVDTYFGMIANDWGYGGIQMNDTTSTRRAIFSIWDQTPSTGPEESTTIAYNSAMDIYRVGRFGGEGTGVQFLANYPWVYGTNYRVAYRMFAEPDGAHVRFNGFLYDASLGTWTYCATHRANTGGKLMNTGWLYSFNENYGGTWGIRDATMSNAWVYNTGSGWGEITSGTVSNIPHGPNDYGTVNTSTNGFEYYSSPTPTDPVMAVNTPVSYSPSASEAPIVIPYNISVGNPTNTWEPDNYWNDVAGDSQVSTFLTPVNTSRITKPAPPAVYQNMRTGSDFQYNLIGFQPNTSYAITLQFVETTASASGQRLINVTANGNPGLTNFDIFATAGAQYKAVSQTFNATSDATGQIVLEFTAVSGGYPAVVSAISTTGSDFTLTAAQNTVNVAQGASASTNGSASTTVTVTSVDSFNAPTALSVVGLPAGVTVSFSSASVTPPANGSANSTLTFSASSSASVGSSTVTVVGTSGSLTSGTGITLNVQNANGINFVQVNANDTSTVTALLNPVEVAYTEAQIAGDLNIIAIGTEDTTSTISSVVDSNGNTYKLAVGPTISTDVGGTQSIYYASNIRGAAPFGNIVTVTFNQQASYPDVRIAEYSGVGVLDAVATATGVTSDGNILLDSGPVTTVTGYELLFGASNVPYWTDGPGAGYIARLTSDWGNIVEDKVVYTTGTYDATATQSATPYGWIMQMATFGPQSNFSISASPTSLAVSSGSSGSATITLTNLNKTASFPITFSISSLPSNVTASFSPTSVTLPANGTATSTLTLTATKTASAGFLSPSLWLPGVVLFVLSLIPLSRRRRSFSAKVLPLVVCTLFLVLGAVGCNGSGTTTTPATPYTVTVTATSGTVSQSSSFVLLLSK